MRINLRDISIKYKIIGIIMLTSAIVLLVASASFFINDLITFKRSLVDSLSTTSTLIGTDSRAALTFGDKEAAEETLAVFAAEPRIISAGIYTPDGGEFARYLRAEIKEDTSCITCHQLKNLPDHTTAVTTGGGLLSPVHLKESYFFGDNNLVLLQPIVLEGETIGIVCIQSDLHELSTRQRRYVSIYLLVMATSIFVAYMLSSRFQHVISKPILKLAETMRVVSEEKEYSIREEKQSDDELGTLIAGFNEMLEQIQERDRKLEQHRDKLEEDVAKRTGELSETNRSLEQAMVNVRERTQHLEKVNEELLIAQKEAEYANQAKSQFLANMSHDIRTPLNGIIGITELVAEAGLDESQSVLFQTITTEADALLNLINDILDFSKIEAGRLELEEIPFDMRTVIDGVASTFSYNAEQKGLEFISFLSPDVPSRLIGDPGRLRQILVNLTGNALKFTHNGEIYIKAELTEDIEDRVKVRFSVKDTGIGIPEDKQSNIFESFSQADGSTTRKYGGTGLGTTISKQLTELMGGKIGVESEVGKGSTFWFEAVFAKDTDHEAILEKEEVDLRDLQVLIVDDNHTNRYVLKEYLKSWGCIPVESSGGKEALSLLKESALADEPFKLLMTDFQMPEISGFDLAGKIRSTEALKGLLIIMLTSSGRRGDGKRCRDIGIDGYLSKPIRRHDLYEGINAVLDPSRNKEIQREPILVTRHTIADDQRKKVQILLVEDYPANQVVALGHLNSAGYKVDLAENGREAVQAFKRKQYSVILMDIQMPEMDGYAATKEIRNLESGNKDSHSDDSDIRNPGAKIQKVPIIAMTAHAMEGYREECLRGGMDDYISKPLRRKAFLAMLDKWAGKTADLRLPTLKLGPNSEKPESTATVNPQPAAAESQLSIANSQSKDAAPMNFEKILENFGGDRELLIEAMNLFLKSVRSQIGILRQGISNGDADIVRNEAHSIRGGAASLTANDLLKVALELENNGKTGNLEKSMVMLERLEKEFYRLDAFANGL